MTDRESEHVSGRVRESVRGRAPRGKTGYFVFSLVLLAVGTSVCIVQYKVPGILEPIMAAYGMDSATGSWLMSIFTATGIFLSLPSGALAKRLGPKRLLLLACAIVVAGSVMGALAGSALVMVLSRGVEGVAFVFVTVAAPLAIEQYVAPERQGSANGIWSLWICLGSVIGSTATPALFAALGIPGVWLAYAAIVVVAALVLAFVVKGPATSGVPANMQAGEQPGQAPETARAAEREPEAETRVKAADYLRFLGPQALLFFFAYLVFNVEILAVLSYTPTFLQREGMDASLSGFAASLPGLLAVASALVVGKLVDKTGRTKPFYLVGLLASAPGTFLMLTQTGPLLWVGAALVGLVGYGIPVACLSGIPQIAGSKELLPAAMGIFTLVQCLGEFLGSLVTPMLLGPALENWAFCGAVMCGFGLLGALAMALCRIR